MVTAMRSTRLGAKVCIIERAFFGGDCLNNGCVPSKAFLKAGQVAKTIKSAAQFGIKVKADAIEIDFPAIMQRMRDIRAKISDNDSAEGFKKFGIDVHLGSAQFIDAETIEVAGKKVKFNKAVVATGGKPRIPQIPGLDQIEFHTSETIFNLTE